MGNERDDLQPNRRNQAARGILNAAAGAIPFIGGVLSASAAHWSEREQDGVNEILKQWIQMLEDELHEKGKTISEIVVRLDMQDETIRQRIESADYQALLKKAFRNWSSVDTEYKRQRIRNILANAAAANTASDEVVRLFLDWMGTYSDFHFAVIAEIYRRPGISRGEIWRNLGKSEVREDSADADLFRMLMRDLSTGGVIRQERQTDYQGNFLKKSPQRTRPSTPSRVTKSAFEETELYELTGLGKQFVHYAMNEITAKIEFSGP